MVARLAAPMFAALALAGCATRSADVAPLSTDFAPFTALDCEALYDESDAVRQRAAEVAYALDARSGANIVALGVGVTVFWPALVAMRPSGADARTLAELRGRDEAVHRAMEERHCSPMPTQMSAARASALPIAPGDRLVYEERAAQGGPPRELGLRVSALRRNEIDFVAESRGGLPPQPWVQDTLGNQPQAQPGQGWVTWRRLLKHDLVLGDVLAGDLVGPDDLPDAPAVGHVRGQVIALGVKHSLGRPFDAAVIELFGDVPDGTRSTRLDGVMVVDRKSGVLLRLELHSGNPAFALRRTLVRIEPPARTAAP